MLCPKCSKELLCPCENCAGQNRGQIVYKRRGPTMIECGHCKEVQPAPDWQDRDVRRLTDAADLSHLPR